MKQREKIVPIILAAGSSKRLGFPKPLAKFDEKTALEMAVANCAELGRAVVVLGCDARQVVRHVPPGTATIVNGRWREGQLGSILCALRHLPSNAAILIYPVDHPLLGKNILRKLVRAFESRKAGQEIVMPHYRKRYGHPVILSAALRRELFHAMTAREVVYRDPRRIKTCRVRTSAIYEDFDSPESYRRCLRKIRAGGEPRR